ncbi:MAG TPA: YcxB family protein [Aggregatilineaceae bacterium]|nr:YcxB family protein [Aggregatilineaceae bacterium]
MTIRTKEVELTKKQYFKILTSIFYSRAWHLQIICGVLLICCLLEGNYSFAGLICCSLLYPPYANWHLVNSKENRNSLLKCIYEFDDTFFTEYGENGNIHRIRLDGLTRIVRKKHYYLLSHQPSQFFYVPRSAFQSEEDAARVEIMLQGVSLKQSLMNVSQ